MTTRLFRPLVIVVATVLLAGGAAAGDRLNVEYSADQVIETEDGIINSHINSTPTKERREMTQDGMPMILITHYDKAVTWNLMPEEKMYMEMSIKDASPESDDLSAYKIEQTPSGQETLNGQSMKKSKIVMTHSDGSKLGGFMWTTQEGILAKIDAIAVDKKSKDRFKMEQTNIKIGKQPADLFEIPAGYEKVSMGGMGMDMLKGMMGK